ncbi:MAG: hypothetical protein E7056_00930 [Lentisphaerae bacterium]|nr:hypothetical protein [Lentisphaerota bacterium]
MKKYLLPALPLLFAVLSAATALKRELWFDEALTLLNFMLPLSFSEIYLTYPIPNNQIVFTLLLKIWDCFYFLPQLDMVFFWRLLPLAAALGMAALLIALRRKTDDGELYPTVLVLSCLSVSGVFINYATALRGYSVSWLFAAAALWGLYRIFNGNSAQGWLIYAASCLLAVGTVPTNLLMLVMAGVYAMPWMQEKFWRDRRFYAVFGVILLALIVFYAPIARQFLATFKLGEGFSGRGGAILMVLGMYLSVFGLPLLLAPWGISLKERRNILRWLLWLMPIATILILHRAPFPRVFVPVLPILAMTVIDGVRAVINSKWRNFHRTVYFITVICFQILMIPTGFAVAEYAQLSRYEDDFFHPWYMLPRYQVSDTARQLTRFPADQTIFASFNSDPMPIIFYLLQQNDPPLKNFHSDLPFNSVKNLPGNSIVILRKDEDPAACGKRFNGTLDLIHQTRSHNIFRFRKM